MMKFLDVIKQMLITNKCLLCHEPISHDNKSGFCEVCIADWNAFLDVKCVRCGYKINECSCMPKLIKQTSKYGFVTCVFYNPDTSLLANNLIFTLKRDLDVDLINFFAEMMVKNLNLFAQRHGLNYDEYTVTYVTRREEGIRMYDFDHTKYLAKAVAKKLGIECQKTILNVGETEQKSLTKVERLENAKISYEINEKADVRGRKYLLIDDIITSGATMKACADVLRENGAEEIIPVSFAKNNG